jgi:hypothetical protein
MSMIQLYLRDNCKPENADTFGEKQTTTTSVYLTRVGSEERGRVPGSLGLGHFTTIKSA